MAVFDAVNWDKKRNACGKYPIFCSYQSVKALVLSLKNGIFILPKAEQKSGTPAANTQFFAAGKASKPWCSV
jgi:hypothetical protein